MRVDRPRKSALNGKAAVAAGLSALVLAGIGFWATAVDNAAPVEGAIGVGLAAAAFGSVVGMAGASVGSLGRASFVGAFMFGLFVAFPVLIAGSLLEPVSEWIWFSAAICSLGSILAQIGAVVGGAVADQDELPRAGQFTLKQLLAFFIPVAIYFGYVSAHARK